MHSMQKTFQSLPVEILDSIVSLLDRQSLFRFNLCAKWSYDRTVPLIWHEVTLVDRTVPARENGDATRPEDEHDDTFIIRKLLVIAQNERIAQCVQILNHRCHHEPPLLLSDLPDTSFIGQTLSYDPRLMALVRLAAEKLEHLHTLRIIHGHPRLVEALIRCLFDRRRTRKRPIRRLWLEYCRLNESLDFEIAEHKNGLDSNLDFSSLESVRFRRLPLEVSDQDLLHTERTKIFRRTDSHPKDVFTEWEVGGCAQSIPLTDYALRSRLQNHYKMSNWLDDDIFDDVAADVELPLPVQQAHIASHIDRAVWAYSVQRHLKPRPETMPIEYSPDLEAIFRKVPAPATSAITLLQQCSSTLTSVNFDWIMLGLAGWSLNMAGVKSMHEAFYLSFFRLRFPHLRALQFRNCVTLHTSMPHNLYLLGPSHWPDCGQELHSPPDQSHDCMDKWATLSFMEAHPGLQCLAWPAGRFLSLEQCEQPSERIRKVIQNLSRNLTDLRLDNPRLEEVEPDTEPLDKPDRQRRRQLIKTILPHLLNVKHIKISGMIPHDERREILRALHKCPIERVSLIGVNSAIGNTWWSGFAEQENWTEDRGHVISREQEQATRSLGMAIPAVPEQDFKPAYGWNGAAPMVTTIAGQFGKTLRELKVCGHIGSPMMFTPSPITVPLLNGLKYLHQLEMLTISLWLDSWFEGESRGEQIVDFWLAPQDPNATALVVLNDNEAEPGTWQEMLKAFEPSALALKIVEFIGGYLSDKAKQRTVLVRASFNVGVDNLHDMDVRIGKDVDGRDICLSFVPPRDELERGRRDDKLNTRRWF